MEKSKQSFIDLDSGAIYETAEEAKEAKEQKELEEAERKNPPFFQLAKGVGPTMIAKLSNKSPTAIHVLMFFFENMDDYNVIMVSQQVIATNIKKSRQAVANAIKVLEEENIIGIGKVGQTNVYLINPKIAWQKAFKQRSMVKMKGNVILGEEENKELFKRFESLDSNDELKLNNNNFMTNVVGE